MRNYDHPNLFNFRDLGGYAGHEGRTVRWRRLFRSDSLSRIDPADAGSFTALGVRTVIDLRRPREIDRDGRIHAFPGLTYHHISPVHAEWEEAPAGGELSDARWLADRYLDLAEHGRAAIVAAVGVIADAGNAPVVVHCVAGKDRTGVVSGITLAALGVDDAVVAEDYALTTAATERSMAYWRGTNPGIAGMPARWLASPAETMLLFLAEVRARYGSLDAYLGDPSLAARLREHLLEDGS
ncbi:tyrosine-protein phosphatase [Dactylosporangium sucinum]|uniref:tyrosine-protein phosphatase n=1 Tax=Dactylosporangium sucinum TaxID=1424081 RepID=UPI001E3D93C7|nr:tyrosine-protein phosphatase [Dactylosporangium sucinum]